jgi:hypothetical protein
MAMAAARCLPCSLAVTGRGKQPAFCLVQRHHQPSRKLMAATFLLYWLANHHQVPVVVVLSPLFRAQNMPFVLLLMVFKYSYYVLF